MGTFVIDTSLLPMVFVKYPHETTEKEIDMFFEELNTILERGKIVGIIDLSDAD